MAPLNIPIQMISVCDVDGELRPLRFRFEDAEHRLRVVKVAEILVSKELNYVGVQCFQYLCRAVSNERELLFELRYAVRAHQWTLYRLIG